MGFTDLAQTPLTSFFSHNHRVVSLFLNQDSNSWPHACQTSALPFSYIPGLMQLFLESAMHSYHLFAKSGSTASHTCKKVGRGSMMVSISPCSALVELCRHSSQPGCSLWLSWPPIWYLLTGHPHSFPKFPCAPAWPGMVLFYFVPPWRHTWFTVCPIWIAEWNQVEEVVCDILFCFLICTSIPPAVIWDLVISLPITS